MLMTLTTGLTIANHRETMWLQKNKTMFLIPCFIFKKKTNTTLTLLWSLQVWIYVRLWTMAASTCVSAPLIHTSADVLKALCWPKMGKAVKVCFGFLLYKPLCSEFHFYNHIQSCVKVCEPLELFRFSFFFLTMIFLIYLLYCSLCRWAPAQPTEVYDGF